VSAEEAKWVFAPPWKLGLRTKNVRKSEVSISIPIDLILAITLYLPGVPLTLHKSQRHCSGVMQ